MTTKPQQDAPKPEPKQEEGAVEPKPKEGSVAPRLPGTEKDGPRRSGAV